MKTFWLVLAVVNMVVAVLPPFNLKGVGNLFIAFGCFLFYLAESGVKL
jgi:hypothetical protein